MLLKSISKTFKKLKYRQSFLSCLFIFVLVASFGLGLFFIFIISYYPFNDSGQSFLPERQYLENSQNAGPLAFDLNIIQETALEGSAPAFTVTGSILGSLGGFDFDDNNEVRQYKVKPGDTLSSIARQFGISVETLWWANHLKKDSKLRVGQELVVLPVSGVLHVVREGDTINEIAQLYKAKPREIAMFNDIFDENKIYAGDLLIIPGGKKPKIYQKYNQVPLPGSYFICPIPSPCKITQGLHWYNAVDFSNGKCGEPVFAAAGGKVQRTGYGKVSGYYVRLLHPNGVVTFYGHLSKIAVKPGQRVYQGQIIGYVGHTGLTIPRGARGCHLHFDVRFARNPFSGYRVGTSLGK